MIRRVAMRAAALATCCSRVPALRRLVGRVIGLGVRPEHVRV